MTGRATFARWRWALGGLAALFSVTPSPLRRFLWSAGAPFSGSIATGLRYALLKSEAEALGDNVYLGEHLVLRHAAGLSIGENCSIHPFCYLDGAGTIRIGRDVAIAHGVSILSSNHGHADPEVPIKYNPLSLAGTRIDDDVWIGCGARILAGVHIGRRCIVAAGAVVTRDIPPNSLAAGVPARVIRKI